jgi:hypothetical protein
MGLNVDVKFSGNKDKIFIGKVDSVAQQLAG